MVDAAEAKQLSWAATSLLLPDLEFGISENGTYPSEDFQLVLARIASDGNRSGLFLHSGIHSKNSAIHTVNGVLGEFD